MLAFRENKNYRNSGMSLPAVLVFIAIIGIIGLVISQQFKSEFQAQERLDIRVSQLAIFEYVKRVMDCDATRLVYPSCPSSGFLRVASKAVGIPVAIRDFSIGGLSDATTIGAYYVRARCSNPRSPGDKRIFLEASPIKLRHPVWSKVNPNAALGCVLP